MALPTIALKLKAITYEIEKDRQLLLKLRNSKESNKEKKQRPNNEKNWKKIKSENFTENTDEKTNIDLTIFVLFTISISPNIF